MNVKFTLPILSGIDLFIIMMIVFYTSREYTQHDGFLPHKN
ncbi:hypothetical protein (plasmid) [Metabacillus dongyingensis]|nr:hypothetical protein [Metabacillus dongyingensis]